MCSSRLARTRCRRCIAAHAGRASGRSVPNEELRTKPFGVGPPLAPASSSLSRICSLAVAAAAVVVLSLRIGHVLTGDIPLIVAAVLVVLGGALEAYDYFLQAKAWEAILPDYEAGKTARERSERLRSLAREIVSRTTTGVWGRLGGRGVGSTNGRHGQGGGRASRP